MLKRSGFAHIDNTRSELFERRCNETARDVMFAFRKFGCSVRDGFGGNERDCARYRRRHMDDAGQGLREHPFLAA